MNIWEILGIEPTRDQGAVRRAYAAAAAQYNPEEHPEEFLAVRQYASKQRRDRKQWDIWFTSPEFLAVYRDPAFTAALHQAVEELKKEFPLCKDRALGPFCQHYPCSFAFAAAKYHTPSGRS